MLFGNCYDIPLYILKRKDFKNIMWICPKCNAQNESLLQCENCGEKRPQDNTQQDSAMQDVIMTRSHRKKFINYKKIAIIVVSAAAAVILAIGVYVIITDAIKAMDKSKQQQQISQQELDRTNKQAYDEHYLFADDTTDQQKNSSDKSSEQAEQQDQSDDTQTDTDEFLQSSDFSIGITEYGEVTAANAIQYSIPRGVMVFKITAGSIAEKIGLMYGDVITKINDDTVLYATDVKKALSDGYGSDIMLEIFRNGLSYNIKITTDMQSEQVSQK